MPPNNLEHLQLAYISASRGERRACRLGFLQSRLSGADKFLELPKRNELFTLRHRNNIVANLTTESIKTICDTKRSELAVKAFINNMGSHTTLNTHY